MAGGSLSETVAFATKNGAGTWEMMATANSPNGDLVYGCTNNNYLTWKTFDIASTGEGDTTGGYDSRDGLTYISSFSSQWALRLFWTAEPCPVNGNPAWTTRSWTFVSNPYSVDHPTFVYDPVYNTKYVVWTETAANNVQDLMVGAVQPNLSMSYWSAQACSNFHKTALVPSATVDTAGNLHIVYLDYTTGTDGMQHIVHELFRANQGGFACYNSTVGPYVWPSIGCGPTGQGCWNTDASGNKVYNVHTWPGVGNPASCIRANPAPSIAIDNAATNNLIVVYGTISTDTYCGAGTAETYLYRSLNTGVSWVPIWRSCPYEAVFPRVAAGTIPGGPSAPGLFHAVTDVAVSMSPYIGLAPFDIKSTDGGATWAATGNGWLSSAFLPTPIYSNCYAGDYEGASADLTHSRFFYSWGAPYETTAQGTTWAIEGNTNDP